MHYSFIFVKNITVSGIYIIPSASRELIFYISLV